MKKVVTKIILALVLVSLVTACGYRPSAHFSRDILGQKISTDVKISSEDPQNTVLIKDAIDSALVESLQSSLTTRPYSDTHLVVSMGSPRYSPTQYDSNGYVIGYRMSVTLNITKHDGSKSKSYSVSGTYDFSVTPNSIVTDQQRFDAIKFSASKAINAFIAKISAEGARNKKG